MFSLLKTINSYTVGRLKRDRVFPVLALKYTREWNCRSNRR